MEQGLHSKDVPVTILSLNSLSSKSAQMVQVSFRWIFTAKSRLALMSIGPCKPSVSPEYLAEVQTRSTCTHAITLYIEMYIPMRLPATT